MRNALCYDMGGSKIVCGLVREDGVVLWKSHLAWSPKDGGDILRTLKEMGDEARRENPAVPLDCIGANIPGIADDVTGTWVEASFSGIGNIPVAQQLREMYGLPAFADNDGQTCTLAEKIYGGAQDCDAFLYLTVSNGVGGGVYLNGLVRGCGNRAGEFGHCVVERGGRQCKCGQKGCLERYAAGPGIRQTWLEMTGETKEAAEIAALARQGDERAQQVWTLEGQYLGHIIAIAANLLNVEKVIIGGGISLSFDLYRDSLERTVAAELYQKPEGGLVMMPTPLKYDGGLLAAAAVAFTGMKQGLRPCAPQGAIAP